MLLCKEFIMAEDSPHMTMQDFYFIFNVVLVFVLVSICCDTSQAKAYFCR